MKKTVPTAPILPIIAINTDMIRSYRVHKMSNREFRKKFEEIIHGGHNDLSEFVRMEDVRIGSSRWNGVREHVFKRDGFRCTYCGTTDGPFQCDHMIPLRRGGTNSLDNLTTACADCNRRKHAKTVEEFAGVL